MEALFFLVAINSPPTPCMQPRDPKPGQISFGIG
jgi:hypothetical protein